jgi:hypothetical protein
MTPYETVAGLVLGLGLSAACGFRVFVPLLAVSAAGLAGWLPLAEGFRWVATWPALTALAVATVVETVAYHVPWLDHALDTLAAPAAVLAGTLLTASQLGELEPLAKWTLALIAGGGAAGMVQGTTTALRAVSTITTGGLANPIFASLESFGAVVTAVGSLLLPVFGLLVVLVVAGAGLWLFLRRRRQPPRPLTTDH